MPSFLKIIASLIRSPQRILCLWNWKSAWLSVLLRTPIFLVAAIPRGFRAAVSATVTESAYCMVAAGFFGAIVQSLRDAQPEWMTLLFLTVALPAMFQGMEYLLHRASGTPHLMFAEVVSICATGISAIFTWYSMRRGALLVGGEGAGFLADLRSLPGLFFQFASAPFRWLKLRGRERGGREGRGAPGTPGAL